MESDNLFGDFEIDPYLFYDAIVKSTDDYIYVIDMKTDKALISENMWKDFELPGRIVEGLVEVWGELILDRDKQRYYDSIQVMLEGKTDEHHVEYQIRNRKEEYVWVTCRGILKYDQQGEPLMFAGVVTNLGIKGKIDPITGLFTQSECSKIVTRYLEQEEACGGVLLLGLDDFSRINALHDHIFGNGVLRQFAQTVQRYLPETAQIFRFDGDEFAIVYMDADRQKVYELYQKLYAYSNCRQTIDNTSYFCTVSAGIAMMNEDADNYLDLIKYAASALEASKHKGKNTVTFFSPDLIQGKLKRMELGNLLRSSVMNGMKNFEVYYQPLVDAKDMKTKGAEALLRWKCDEFGSVGPNIFIPLLESSGLINQVGLWVFEEAVKMCGQWISLYSEFVMNVNISYLQMLDRDFVDNIADILKKHGLEPRHIVLELTESYFVTDMSALKEVFRQLRAIGIRIAMDDFGTGYSSLGLLSQSPADIVKIDRLFIRMIHENDFHLQFISSVIMLCHSVGISVTVEGVENEDEMNIVRSIEADCLQGFYFSKPVPAKQFEEGPANMR